MPVTINRGGTSKPTIRRGANGISAVLRPVLGQGPASTTPGPPGPALPADQIAALDAKYAPQLVNGKQPVRRDELVFNVKDYGAKGDGSTDDTAAIDAALAAMPLLANTFSAASGLLYFPAGRYLTTGGHSVPNGKRIAIRGAGRYHSIIYKTSGTADLLTISAAHSGVQDLSLDCASAPTAGDGLVLDAGFTWAKNCQVVNQAGNGITIGKTTSAINHVLDHLTVTLNRGYGIHNAGNSSTDGEWSNVNVGKSGKSGVRLQAGGGQLSNVHVWSSGIVNNTDHDGFWIESRNNMLGNCESETNLGRGVYLAVGSDATTITGGSYWGNMGNGIYGFNSHRHSITGATIHDNAITNTAGSSSASFAQISNESGTEWALSGNNIYDGGGAIGATSYSPTPAFPYPGRGAVFTAAFHYAESNTGTGVPDRNVLSGNIMRKQRTRTGVSHLIIGPATHLASSNNTGNTSAVRKAADGTAVNNSTTLVNDPSLVVDLDSNSVYRVRGFLIYDASTNADFKLGWTVPSGATFSWQALGPGVTVGAAVASLTLSVFTAAQVPAFGAFGTGVKFGLKVEGTLATGSVAGQLQLQWAQNTADPTDTFVRADSTLSAERL